MTSADRVDQSRPRGFQLVHLRKGQALIPAGMDPICESLLRRHLAGAQDLLARAGSAAVVMLPRDEPYIVIDVDGRPTTADTEDVQP